MFYFKYILKNKLFKIRSFISLYVIYEIVLFLKNWFKLNKCFFDLYLKVLNYFYKLGYRGVCESLGVYDFWYFW